jgi:hypothetical protein
MIPPVECQRIINLLGPGTAASSCHRGWRAIAGLGFSPLGGFFFARVHERFGVVGIQALSGIVECVCVDSRVPSN